LCGSVPYRPQTISATDHIGHNHIGHKPYWPQPHRQQEKTISAKRNNRIGHKKIYCYLASTFISCQSQTRNVVCNRVSRKRRVKECNIIVHIFQSTLKWVYNCYSSWSTTRTGAKHSRKADQLVWCSAASLSYLLTIVDSTAHLNIAYRHWDRTFKK